MTGISTFLILHLVDGKRELVRAHLRYNPADPYAAQLDFGIDEKGEPIVWMFARDLLRDAFSGPAGYGDFRCWAMGEVFYVAISTRSDRAAFTGDADRIRAFLIDAEDLVPYGTESSTVDAELDALLKGGAR